MFGLKKKPQPTINTESFSVSYDGKSNYWCLHYRDVEFNFPGVEIDLPSTATLDLYLSWIERHKAHIEDNVKAMCERWEDVFVDPSKYHVALIEVESDYRIAVMILGDDTWGDMGYDIWIEDGAITKEGFGD